MNINPLNSVQSVLVQKKDNTNCNFCSFKGINEDSFELTSVNNEEIKQTPAWMKEYLKDCFGLIKPKTENQPDEQSFQKIAANEDIILPEKHKFEFVKKIKNAATPKDDVPVLLIKRTVLKIKSAKQTIKLL